MLTTKIILNLRRYIEDRNNNNGNDKGNY
jgi:hypothetical protein